MVFDPFAGMGTTLFAAMLRGLASMGVEKLPVAAFVAETLPKFRTEDIRVASLCGLVCIMSTQTGWSGFVVASHAPHFRHNSTASETTAHDVISSSNPPVSFTPSRGVFFFISASPLGYILLKSNLNVNWFSNPRIKATMGRAKWQVRWLIWWKGWQRSFTRTVFDVR